jgi:hypothetical protein
MQTTIISGALKKIISFLFTVLRFFDTKTINYYFPAFFICLRFISAVFAVAKQTSFGIKIIHKCHETKLNFICTSVIENNLNSFSQLFCFIGISTLSLIITFIYTSGND